MTIAPHFRLPAPSTTRRRSLQRLALGATACALGPVALIQARAQSAAVFGLGVASGYPSPQGMVLWTRLVGSFFNPLPKAVPVQWELADDEAFTRVVARGEEMAVAADAHSVHAEPKGLAAGRSYWYRFTALDQRSAVGRTRTAPAADAKVSRLNLVVASCQRWEQGHYAAWREVAEQPPELVLFLGDYIYEYASGPSALRRAGNAAVFTLDQYRDRYAVYKSDPHLQAAHRAAPWVAIWDDHEVENDYANLRSEKLVSEHDFRQRRAAAYQAWWEHMPVPKAMRPTGHETRIWGQLDWGQLARCLWVDTRQSRDHQVCPPAGAGGGNVVRVRDCPEILNPARSLLGAEQEAWLAKAWSTAHTWNLLGQPTLMARRSFEALTNPSTDGRYGTDAWDGYPGARQRLLATVAERKVPGCVVLGGDLHANYAANLKLDFDDDKSATVASEFCGTSISSSGGNQNTVNTLLARHPHLLHGRTDQRGYMRILVEPQRTHTDLRVVLDPRDPASALASQAQFVVESASPGVMKA